MMNKITILGSGTSTGVPILGCKCHVCQSRDPRNKRFRTSALIETSDKKNFIIDASPDLRTQLLAAGVDHVEGVIITHDHADHTHGMDDLRPFSFVTQKDIPVLTSPETAASLRIKFPYIFQRDEVFKDKKILGGGIPKLRLEEVRNEAEQLSGESFEFFSLPHGHTHTLGVCHQGLAYLVDCQKIPQETLKKLRAKNLDILVIDCLKFDPHDTHLHLDLALEYAQEINAKLTLLTHLSHDFDYPLLLEELEKRRVKNIIPALDGSTFLYSAT
jgi:phosphoribosyl 1,2-cyclic phosphate phosphodiesterase